MKKTILTSLLIYSIFLFFRVFANESIDHDSNYYHDLIKIKNGEFGEPNNSNNKDKSLFGNPKYSDEQNGNNVCSFDKYYQEINVSGTYYLKTINGVIYIC